MLSSSVWILAPDSSQPRVHRDQSTCKYSCPGPQVEPHGVPGPRASLTPIVGPGRSLPDPTQDPDSAAGQTPGHAALPGRHRHRALSLHQALSRDGLQDLTFLSAEARPGLPSDHPASISWHLALLGSRSPGGELALCFVTAWVPPFHCFLCVFVYPPHCLPPSQVSA